MHGALTGRYDSLASDIRTALRDADMKVADVERSGLSVVANFDSANARDDATSELRRRIPNMEFSDGTPNGGKYPLTGQLTASAITAVQTHAIKQNIQTDRKSTRLNSSH